jgi:hypothetical protein
MGRFPVLLLLLTLIPAAAAACPVCFSAVNREVLYAYYVATAAMTLLPLAMVVGIVRWLERNAQETEVFPPDA